MASPGRRLGDSRYGGPGFGLVERTAKTIERHRMLEVEAKVVVGVSGGPDSICLLDVLARLRQKLRLQLEVAHVDHGLSDRSAQVAASLASRVAEAGFEIHVVKAPEIEGPNLQARAREFRYGFFDLIAGKEGATRIATGHTLDDRVETTLSRLVHGAGTEGLAGLPPADGTRIRPLIDSRREETRAYCLECGLDFYDDPANVDLRFERVAVRERIVRAIEDHWGPGAVRAMAASSERLAEDSRALAALADRLYKDSATTTDENVTFDLETMLALPRAFRRRLLERAVGRVRDRSGGIEAALDALESAPDGALADARFSVASGIEIEIGAGRVVVARMAR